MAALWHAQRRDLHRRQAALLLRDETPRPGWSRVWTWRDLGEVLAIGHALSPEQIELDVQRLDASY